MPPWCWLLYLGVAPTALWAVLAWRTVHWQIATDWYAVRTTIWVVLALLVLSLILAAFIATARDPAEKLAGGKSKRTLWVVIGLLVTGVIGGGVGINMVHTRIERAIAEAEPSVGDFFHNAEKTRLAARVVRMMILKQREGITDSASRATLKSLADHVPKAWMALATKQENETDAQHAANLALIEGAHEEGLAAFLFDRKREALDDARWTSLVARWTTETAAAPLTEAPRDALVLRLRITFATSLREGLKLAYEQGDKAWAAMQIDMAVHLMDDARRGVPDDKEEWKKELAALHDDAAAIHGLIMTLDANAAKRHAQTIDRFERIQKNLGEIKLTLARVEDKIDMLLARTAPVATPTGIAPPVIDEDLAASIREMIATGNPLEKAAAEVATAAGTFKQGRWSAADAAIAKCKVWKSSKVDWTEKEEFQFLLVQGDRAVYGDEPDDALPLFERAVKMQPENWDANERLVFALSGQRSGDVAASRERAIAISIRILPTEAKQGAHHTNVLSNLAMLYHEKRQYAAAELLYKRAMAINEKTLGKEHSSVAWDYNNLATLYTMQGKYAAAEPLYTRALAIVEKVHGPEHLDVVRSLTMLASVYTNQARYAEAELLCKRALAIREKLLEPGDPDVAGCLSFSAANYVMAGRYAEAEPLCIRVLAIREKALGLDHIDLASSIINLATVYHHQGRYAEAEPLYKRALAILEKALGSEHLSLVIILMNLVDIYHKTGRTKEAEPLETWFKAILAIKR